MNTRRILSIPIVVAYLSSAAAIQAQDEFAPPPSPLIEWVEVEPNVVELEKGSPLLGTLDPVDIYPGDEGKFLYGPTPGFDVSGSRSRLLLVGHGAEDAEAIKVTRSSSRIEFEFRLPGCEPRSMPVEISKTRGGWRHRIPVALECHTEMGTVVFLDADGDGWPGDIDRDLVAVGRAVDGRKLKFAAFDGTVELDGRRWLATVTLDRACFWPVPGGVRADYVRHVARVNEARRFAGLAPVGLAEELTPLCEKHSAYCTVRGMGHAEDRSVPEFSEEGHYAGMHSCVGDTPTDADRKIVDTLRTLWHRNFYYEPSLTRVGVGQSGSMVSSDVLSYKSSTRESGPILVPPDGALDVPLDNTGEGESPDPYPAGPRGGPFISVLLPPGREESIRRAGVTPRGGAPLAIDRMDPVGGPFPAAGRFPHNDWCLVLVPHQALEPDTIYEVSIECASGTLFEWSFRTAPPQE